MPAGASVEKLGEAAACAVKRIHLDTRMIHAARDAGAKLKEGYEVTDDVSFHKESGLWTVSSSQVDSRQHALLPACSYDKPTYLSVSCTRHCSPWQAHTGLSSSGLALEL